MANRPDVYTPWGSQTWQQNGDQWSQNISLSPQQQAALDSQMAVTTGRSKAAEGLLGQATGSFEQPLDYDGVVQGADRMGTGAGNDWRQKGQDAALEFMRPQQERRKSSLESQLANQGLTRGSEAWNAEIQRDSDQTTRDGLQAFDSGRNETGQMFDQEMRAGGFNQQLRQQNIAELMQQRSQPLNELNALLTGQQVNSPNMPTFNTAGKAETPQLLNAANAGYDASMDAFNAKQQGTAGIMQGVGSIAGAAAMFF